MALADYQKQSRSFDLKGGSFQVEGLSFDKFAKLIREHLSDVEAVIDLVEAVTSGKSDVTESDIEKILLSTAEEAPGLVANVIALASGETDPRAVVAAASLPLPVQFEVMTAIVELTFSEVGGIKKAWETITSLLKKVK